MSRNSFRDERLIGIGTESLPREAVLALWVRKLVERKPQFRANLDAVQKVSF